MEKLKPMEAAMLNSIKEYIKRHGYAPSIREIGDMVGLKSTSSVHAHMTKMYEKGIIETDETPGTPRAIRVPGYEFRKI